MKVKLPAVLSADIKVSGIGRIRQRVSAEEIVDCQVILYSLEKDRGYVLVGPTGEHLVYLFPKTPRSRLFGPTARVLVTGPISPDSEFLDVGHCQWLLHPALPRQMPPATQLVADSRATWRGAFRFIEEGANTVGMRRPQLGALHAIHAHWTTSADTATIVMPTGTGKTETMLATLISAECGRVLVVVPTDALRTQLAAKFETLGILKLPQSEVLAPTTSWPVVGRLHSRPTSVEDAESFFAKCNVVVTTSQLVGSCSPEVQQLMAEMCSELFIDEAHHAEAPTWRKFRERFEGKRVLQFTATPFREDGQMLDGKFIFVYPLRKAQEEGYFRPIRFHPVREFNRTRGDRKIALAALQELDADVSGKHIVMARVSSIERAGTIHELYQSLGRYKSVAIHSKMTLREREAAKRELAEGVARIVVCVDMLGEGFDMPELKIAAFHDIRKSLAVTLQLAGRFTRARADLGDAVFIANTELIDVTEELRTLYSQDPDWNALLPQLSSAAIDDEVVSQTFFEGFGTFPNEIPLKDLRPAASMVVYRTRCAAWSPESYKKGFRAITSRAKLYQGVNDRENSMVVVAAYEQGVAWSGVESVREHLWELFVAVWDAEKELLYIHGSGISSEYKELAKALCGDDVQLVVAPTVYRCFHGVNRLVLNNVGLDEHLGRQLRFTARMGSDVEARIGEAARRGAKRAVLAGKGFERGKRASIGAAKRGRVWSSQRLRVDTFASWARDIGTKLADESINPDHVLTGTLKPVAIGAAPRETAICVEWPLDVISRAEDVVRFAGEGATEEFLTGVDIDLESQADDGAVVICVYSEAWHSLIRLELFKADDAFDFRFVHVSGARLRISIGPRSELLTEFLTRCPPTVWYADGSSLEGCEYTELPSAGLLPFARERLRDVDWTGVDISKESQHEHRQPGTVQHRLIEMLQQDPSYHVIFDDDGSGEAADVVTVTHVDEGGRSFIEVELYHCKYARRAPGKRIDDLYVVCGQAQRSTTWLETQGRRTELFTHLLKRNAMRVDDGRSTRFERGDSETLARLRDVSRRVEVKLRVFVVQPGLAKSKATSSQMTLLAVTERYLSDTYEIPFAVICSH